MRARTLAGIALAVLCVASWTTAGGQPRTPGRKGAPPPRAAQATKTEPAPKAERATGQRSDSPIVIDADRMEAIKKEGLVIFVGSVVAKQDNSVQTADRMEVYLDDKGERVQRIVSTGNVKIVTEDCRTGTARRAEYYDDEQRLILIGGAKVWQEENVVTGERIDLLLAEERSTVTGGPRERVKSIFYPRREDQTPDGAEPVAGEARRAPGC